MSLGLAISFLCLLGIVCTSLPEGHLCPMLVEEARLVAKICVSAATGDSESTGIGNDTF